MCVHVCQVEANFHHQCSKQNIFREFITVFLNFIAGIISQLQCFTYKPPNIFVDAKWFYYKNSRQRKLWLNPVKLLTFKILCFGCGIQRVFLLANSQNLDKCCFEQLTLLRDGEHLNFFLRDKGFPHVANTTLQPGAKVRNSSYFQTCHLQTLTCFTLCKSYGSNTFQITRKSSRNFSIQNCNCPFMTEYTLQLKGFIRPVKSKVKYFDVRSIILGLDLDERFRQDIAGNVLYSISVQQ